MDYLVDEIRDLSPDKQEKILKRISHVISDRDLRNIMEDVYHGVPIIEAHQRMGVFRRYYADIARFLDDLEDE